MTIKYCHYVFAFLLVWKVKGREKEGGIKRRDPRGRYGLYFYQDVLIEVLDIVNKPIIIILFVYPVCFAQHSLLYTACCLLFMFKFISILKNIFIY